MSNNAILLFEKSYEKLTPIEQELIDNCNYTYIFFKAYNYNQTGPALYRKEDYFKQPQTTDPKELAIIQQGIEQVLVCKGLVESNPFTNLEVGGFSQLMALFHYEAIHRKTTYRFFLNAQKGILDAITFRHVMDKSELRLYNFVLTK